MNAITFIPESKMPVKYHFMPYEMDISAGLPALGDIISLNIIGSSEELRYMVTTRTFFIQERRWELTLDNKLRQ